MGLCSEPPPKYASRVSGCGQPGTVDAPVPTVGTFFAVAEMSADCPSLSWPAPAAKPNTTKLLLTTTRVAVVFTDALEMLRVLPFAVPIMLVVGRSRLRYVTANPGTTMDS